MEIKNMQQQLSSKEELKNFKQEMQERIQNIKLARNPDLGDMNFID